MTRKVRRLRRELREARRGGIANIALAVIVWIGVAAAWPMAEDIRAALLVHFPDMPYSKFLFLAPFLLVILLGIGALATGIGILNLTGKVADFLRDVAPDEDDE